MDIHINRYLDETKKQVHNDGSPLNAQIIPQLTLLTNLYLNKTLNQKKAPINPWKIMKSALLMKMNY